ISQPPSDDWYSVTLPPGQTSLQLETSTPNDGPGQAVNVLNPHIELRDTANNLIASGTPLADGRNESITSTGLTSGATYLIRVTPEVRTPGESSVPTKAASPFSTAGVVVSRESCPPANGSVDPGESVTVNLKLMNNTANPTSNLTATLQSGGGVLAPTGPQSYGAISPGGNAGRDFSFTADPGLSPGQTITATLHLQDGAADLGNVTFLITAGGSPCLNVRLVATTVLTRTGPSTVRGTVSVQNIG